MSESKHDDNRLETGFQGIAPQFKLFLTKLECMYLLRQYDKSGSKEQREKKDFLENVIQDIIEKPTFTGILEVLSNAMANARDKGWERGDCFQCISKCLDIENLKEPNATSFDDDLAQYHPIPGMISVETLEDKLLKFNICLPLFKYCRDHEQSSSRNIETIQRKINEINGVIQDIFLTKKVNEIPERLQDFQSRVSHLFKQRHLSSLFVGRGEMAHALEAAINIANSAIVPSPEKSK